MKRLLFLLLLIYPVWSQIPSATPKGPPVPIEASLTQEPFKVTVKADQNHFELGQSLHLVYLIQGPEAAQFVFPAADQFAIKPFEVLDANPVTLTGVQGQRHWEYRVKATAYETGQLTLPEANLKVKLNSSGAEQELKLPGLSLEVERITPGDKDKPDEVRDAHHLVLNGVPPLLVLAALAAIALVAALVWWLVRWLRRARHKAVAPPLPPYPWALKQLELLNSERLDKQEEWEAFYDQLSHILRFYLGWRFDLPLLEQTTSETLRSLTLSDSFHHHLKEILEVADMVKFAHSFPKLERSEQHLAWSQQLVESNAPVELEVSKP